MKTSGLHRLARIRKGPCAGSALIIVLCFVLLLTIIVIAFLVHSQLAMQINNSREAQDQLDILSRSVVQFTTADLRQEIAAGSYYPPYSVNNASGTPVNVYVPSSNATLMPSRTGFTPGAAGSDPLDNIVKISKSGVSFFSGPAGTYNSAYPAPALASAVSTAAPSLNGRYIDSTSTGWTTTGWDKPQLIDTTRYPGGLQSAPIPDWIYVTNTGTPRQVLTAPAANVIGRYAYVIYDEGGLLDVNVAGYPSSASANSIATPDARDPQRKGPLALADLTQIPGGINGDALVAWRNQATAAATASSSASSYPSATAPPYIKYLFNGSYNEGFNSIYPGDQKFLSRQDLLAYSAANPSVLPTQSLAYLATFTRALNAPTWTPVTPTGSSFDYASKAENAVSPWPYNVDSVNTRWPANVTITRPKLDADVSSTATTVPTEIVTFNKGDPVIQHRFPLSKIALLSNPAAKTSSPTTVGTVAWAVSYYFGLQWVQTDGTLPEPHWEYIHAANGATLASATDINSIPDVAALKTREPDFFEMLRQGVLRGSAQDLVTLEMGACILDQFSSTDLPTAITNGPGGSLREAFGTKNIPYFSQMLFWPVRPTSDPTRATFEGYLVPMFWNPHRNASTVSSTITSFRIVVTPGTGPYLPIVSISGTLAKAPYVNTYYTSGMTTPGTLTFSTSSGTTYQEPTLISGGASAPAGGQAMSEATNRSGFYLGSAIAPDKIATQNAGGSGTNMSTLTKATISPYGPSGTGSSTYGAVINCTVQCQTSDGTWHTYENVGLSIGTPGSRYWQTTDSAGANGTNGAPSFSVNPFTYFSSVSSGPVDPRISAGAYLQPTAQGNGGTQGGSGGIAHTVLFSASLGSPLPAGATWQPSSTANGSIAMDTVAAQFGYFPQTSSASLTVPASNNLYLGQWNVNKIAASYDDYATIATGVTGDKVQRYGDGLYGAYPETTNQINDRPIILDRPFRSVGELGYAFRGVEWRTIDFCSPFSADAGLLDMFSIGESQKLTQSGGTSTAPTYASVPLTAGIVNINTRHPEVLQSLLSGSLKNDLDTTAASVITPTQASAIADAIVAETANATAGHGPLINRSELVTRIMGLSGVQNQLTSTVAKPEREAVVRALAEPADTRTWNLLVDLDVQTGRYPPAIIQAGGSAGLSQFAVQGERRYWLHLAIDRYNGKVIDEQLEVVHDN